MDDDRIFDAERFQIELIGGLDSEELSADEVDGVSPVDDETKYGGTSTSGEVTFDTCLPSLHTYLGEVEDTRHRPDFFEGGAVLNLPVFYLEGVVLFPEAILPLRVTEPNFVAAIKRALRQPDAPCTIGVVRIYRLSGNRSFKVSSIGTTAKIRQFRQLEDGSMNVVTRGQQRFHLRRRWIGAEGASCGEVQIIQEDLPLRTPRDVVGRLQPLKNFHAGSILGKSTLDTSQTNGSGHDNENFDSDAMSDDSFETALSPSEILSHQSATVSSHDDNDESKSSDDDSEVLLRKSQIKSCMGPFHTNDGRSENAGVDGKGKKEAISMLREVPQAFWPSWVYRMYDSYYLSKKAADRWKQIVVAPCMDGLVGKPDLLSFHIASKIPVSESTRQELLEINGTSYRLHREIELLESFDCIRCRKCQMLIGRRSDMLVMSRDGPLGAYVNPHGAVHEIMTLYKVNGLSLYGNSVEEYSWFPGYAWTIADCSGCRWHMGWKFTAINENLKPRSFWGIRSSQVEDDTPCNRTINHSTELF